MSSRSPPERFQVVAISPNIPGSSAAGMNGEFSRMTIMSTADTPNQSPPADAAGVAFVKGGKRKRLSKACDACHKSKRRCDGTAPCSNCYFASKECTYTDASGRPVPAPRSVHPDRTPGNSGGEGPPPNLVISTSHQPERAPNTASSNVPAAAGVRRQADSSDVAVKRARPEGLSPPVPESIGSSPSVDSGHSSPTSLLDPATTHELINLFFAHCNPHRLIIHKPTFSAALAHDKVPSFLVLAICALAAPWSMDRTAKAPMPRLAGVPFFQEAVSIMFDSSGRLLSEPSLATAQALCLLEMHEVAASHSWTKHYRYFDLALQLLEEALVVSKPDHQLVASLPPAEARIFITERECTRRCFWLIQTMSWINGIYTYRPMRPRCVDLMRVVRLPVDEMSFELAKSPDPEFLHSSGPRSKVASQWGHLCRALSMYQHLETIIATKDQNVRPPLLNQCRESLQIWLASLPDHLRFSEENLDKQIAMFETSSNTGAWCYCFMHTLHPCYVLSLTEAEGRLQAEPIGWVRTQLNFIFKATGNRAKNTILSACTIWTYSKYYPDDPQVQEWDDSFEKLWGFRVTLVADQWRKTQSEQRSQIGRTYPVDSVSQRGEAAPAFAVATSDSSPSSQTASTTSSRAQSKSQPSSTRSSPREQHTVAVAGPRRPSQSGPGVAGHGHSSGRQQQQHIQQQPRQAQYSQDSMGKGPGSQRDAANPAGGPPAGRTIQPQQSLPSLKASGLLDSWKPPTEAFTQASISGPGAGAGHGHSHSQSLGRVNVPSAAPMGFNWLGDGGM